MAKNKKKKHNRKEKSGFDRDIIDIRRVTRVYKGGKRMRLSVFIAVGDKKGRIGLGIGKGPDVRTAQEKAYNLAVKNMTSINLKGRTIPHEIENKYKASKVILKPAAPGTGLIAGSAMRSVLQLAGVKDVLSKRYGTTNSITVAYATLDALKKLKLRRI
jgi:small subunit ribosomal protein S5